MTAWLRKVKTGYIRFVEKQGFPIIVTICVAIITSTAVFTGQQEDPWTAPTPPVSTNQVLAAQLMQQSLREAVTIAPTPCPTPRVWIPPLEQIIVLREFSLDHMEQCSITGLWTIHDALDLQAASGSKVYALSDGVVIDGGTDELRGTWLMIDHQDDIVALYAGMMDDNGYLPGDRVYGGDIIGYSGSGPLDESELAPHLHLRVTQAGAAIDPRSLWN